MLLGQSTKEWYVSYQDEEDEKFQSEFMDKRTALDYLEIFDDAVSISNGKKTILKQDAIKHIKKQSKNITLLQIIMFSSALLFIIYLILLNW